MKYQIEITRKAQKALAGLPESDFRRIAMAIDIFQTTHAHQAVKSSLEGMGGVFVLGIIACSMKSKTTY